MSQPFFNLCMNNRLEEAKALYQAGDIDLGFQDPGKRTPLAMAAFRGHIEMVHWLLEAGSSLDAGSREGKTALGLAASKGRLEIMELLLDAGADPDTSDQTGRTIFMQACEAKQEAAAMLLLERGADAYLADDEGCTMLFYAARAGLTRAVKALLEQGASPDDRNAAGVTPLDAARQSGCNDIVEMLSAGVEDSAAQAEPPIGKAQPALQAMLEKPQKDGDSTLSEAPLEAHPPMTLVTAAQKGNLEALRRLLDSGMDPDARDAAGAVPMVEALKNGQWQAAGLLLQYGGGKVRDDWKASPVCMAGQLNAPHFVRALIFNGTDPNQMDQFSHTPLYYALIAGDTDLAEALVKSGAKVDWTEGKAPPIIFECIRNNKRDAVEWLLRHGADVHAKNRYGQDVLQTLQGVKWAELWHLAQALDPAAQKEFDPQARIIQGIDSLAAAVDHKDCEMVRWYLEQGANPDEIVPFYGEPQPVFVRCLAKFDPEILRLLLEEGHLDVNRKYAGRHSRAGEAIDTYMGEAINHRNKAAIVALLEHGFDLNDAPVSAQGVIPRCVWLENLCERYAFDNRYKELRELIQIFLEHGQRIDREALQSIQYNTLSDNPAEVRELYGMLVERCADINETDDQGAAILHHYLRNYNDMKGVPLEGNRWYLMLDAVFARDDLDVTLRTYSDETPLFIACSRCPAQMVRRLLSLGANANDVCTAENIPAFIQAAKSGDPGKVEALLDFGADIHTVDSKGATALHVACGNERTFTHYEPHRILHLELVPLLLERGADPNMPDNQGNTPLHLLAQEPHPAGLSAMEMLLDHGADINALNQNLHTPFFLSAITRDSQFRNKLQDQQKLLLKRGALADSQDREGRTPLHYAVQNSDAHCVRFLLEQGADPGLADNSGESPYQTALKRNARAVVSVIEKAGTALRLDEDDLDAAFLSACRAGKRGVAEMLLGRGNIDTTYVDDLGRSPLHYVAEMGMLSLAETLIRQGVDVDYTDHAGQTALHFAASSRQREMARLLLANGADPMRADNAGVLPIHLVTNRGQHDLLKLMLESGCPADTTTNDGQTLLMAACYTRSRECARLLLEAGADPNVADNSGVTPAAVAVRNNQKDLLELLHDHGADITASDAQGDMPIHTAASRGFKDMLRELVGMGADVDALNHFGMSPLHVAAMAGRKDTFKYLLDLGADFELKTSDGRSCVDIAAENNQKEIIELIAVIQHRREAAGQGVTQ